VFAAPTVLPDDPAALQLLLHAALAEISVRRVEQRATGQFLNVLGPTGVVVSVAGWMLDPTLWISLGSAVYGSQLDRIGRYAR
jgi:hypothetical protein